MMTNYEQWCKDNEINETTKILFKEWMYENTGEHHSDITGMSSHMYDNLYPIYLLTFRCDLIDREGTS